MQNTSLHVKYVATAHTGWLLSVLVCLYLLALLPFDVLPFRAYWQLSEPLACGLFCLVLMVTGFRFRHHFLFTRIVYTAVKKCAYWLC
jgi:hypothetical protein